MATTVERQRMETLQMLECRSRRRGDNDDACVHRESRIEDHDCNAHGQQNYIDARRPNGQPWTAQVTLRMINTRRE